MLIKCSGSLYVNKVKLQQCDVFKYLGIEIKSTARSPSHILYSRLKQAKIAFYRIRNNAQVLGLSNCRVRLQLATSLVTSVLLFGAPLYACMSDAQMSVTAAGHAFRDLEDFQRTLLRWALRAEVDTRNSMLYVAANSGSAQLLCHKQCWRFFGGLASHPRAASGFVE